MATQHIRDLYDALCVRRIHVTNLFLYLKSSQTKIKCYTNRMEYWNRSITKWAATASLSRAQSYTLSVEK